MTDEYKTISGTSEGAYSELRSKFLAFAHPVTTVEEAMAVVEQYQKKFYDARHVCWAYMLGPEREVFRSNDNGEPSGTAGKPILGQINSFGLTDVVVMVVRRRRRGHECARGWACWSAGTGTRTERVLGSGA